MSTPMPFPAAEFLISMRVLLLRADFEAVAALALMAAAAWTQRCHPGPGALLDDAERVAAATGLKVDAVDRVVELWVREGWLVRGEGPEAGIIYFPWLTRAAAEENARADAASQQASKASNARWRKPAQLKLLPGGTADSNLISTPRRNADRTDDGGWPALNVATSWFCDRYNDRFGAGSANGGEIGDVLRKLKAAGADWGEVQASWINYMKFQEGRWLSAGAWRKKWRDWHPDAQQLDQETLDVARSIDGQIRKGDFTPVGDIVRRGE